MPKYATSAVLDGGPAVIKANAVKLVMLKAYAVGDSAATIATNNIAEVAVSTTDYTLGAQGTNGRKLTCAAKTTGAANTTIAAGAAGYDLHVGHLDAAGNALWVTDETSNQAVTSGNPFDVPAHDYNVNQPT
jgi:hypothetical protein